MSLIWNVGNEQNFCREIDLQLQILQNFKASICRVNPKVYDLISECLLH